MLQPIPLSPINVKQEPDATTDPELHPSWGQWFTSLTSNVNRGAQPTETKEIKAATGVLIGKVKQTVRVAGPTTGTTVITANPRMSTGFDGQQIRIEGQHATKKIQLDDGNGLKLVGGASVVLGESDAIMFHYNAAQGVWIEDYRNV